MKENEHLYKFVVADLLRPESLALEIKGYRRDENSPSSPAQLHVGNHIFKPVRFTER